MIQDGTPDTRSIRLQLRFGGLRHIVDDRNSCISHQHHGHAWIEGILSLPDVCYTFCQTGILVSVISIATASGLTLLHV